MKHPNIVRGYEVFTPTIGDPNTYIVMELMDISLDGLLDEIGCITEK